MKILLDTQIFLWADLEPHRLSTTARGYLADPNNTLFLSHVSVWEMQIKVGIGKLNLRLPLPKLLAEQQQTNNIQLLPITTQQIFALETLPLHHRDPFDRLLIAQAQTESLDLLSVDAVFGSYLVNLLG